MSGKHGVKDMKFQSTLPRGERRLSMRTQSQICNFNPRSREGSDECRFAKVDISEVYFNPRSREGSDICGAKEYAEKYVISIHAPARGATVSAVLTVSIPPYFNPRSREGSDKNIYPIIFDFGISIHAPARGATQNATHISIQMVFQSTLPRGERLITIQPPSGRTSYFNPRSREGSDCKNTQTTNIISVYFYLYYIIFVSLATNTAYITITKPSKCRCESPYTFC